MSVVPSGAFHVRHDLTPALARDVLLLLRLAPAPDGGALLERARNRDYSLGRLSSADKVLASLRDLGLVVRGDSRENQIQLSRMGRAVAEISARDSLLFGELIHLRYWHTWSDMAGGAAFGWAYRLVATTLWEAAPTAVDPDRLVTAVLTAAEEKFGLRSVSFSRSSVLGVLHWLRSLAPACITESRQFTRRVAAAPESFLFALEAARREAAIPAGLPIRLDAALRDRVSRTLLLEPGSFDDLVARLEEGYGVARLREPGMERIVVAPSGLPDAALMEILI